MVGKLTRRTFSQGSLALAVAATAIPALAASKSRSPSRTPANRARWIGNLKAALTTLTIGHLAGYGELSAKILGLIQAQDPEIDAKRLARVFQLLLTGDAGSIETALRANAYPIELASQPLILLGRAELLPLLHDNVLRRLGPKAKSDFTSSAAVALAAGDEWDHALRILARAKETGAGVEIQPMMEDRLWKYAYLYRRVDTVMPVLAETPFMPEFSELVPYRKWRLKAYQIRAGLAGERVPIIEGEQDLGYSEAAAMQVAALVDDAAAADYVAQLRSVMKGHTVSTALAERGFALSVTNVSQAIITAEIEIAAHRKDVTRVHTLARTPLSKVLLHPPTTAIEAFLDERDWRAAATIAEEHNPVKRAPDPEDDAVRRRYVELYTQIAVAAAREGHDADAAALLTRAGAADRIDNPIKRASAIDGTVGFSLVFAVVADNRLPRKYLSVAFPVFINPDDRDRP